MSFFKSKKKENQSPIESQGYPEHKKSSVKLSQNTPDFTDPKSFSFLTYREDGVTPIVNDPTKERDILIVEDLRTERKDELMKVGLGQFKPICIIVTKTLSEQQTYNTFIKNLLSDISFLRYTANQNIYIITDEDMSVLQEKVEKSSRLSEGSQGAAKILFDGILSEALEKRCSDIHIVVSNLNGTEVFFKINGELEKIRLISTNECETMLNAIYNTDGKGKVDNFNKNKIQQAVIDWEINKRRVQLRFQSIPIYDGFKIIMRVLDLGTRDDSLDKNAYLTLDKLGYSPSQIEIINQGISKPQGATIIAGVTSSGKSTTLKNLLMYMNKKTEYKKCFYSIEDPVEYIIPGVAQINVARTGSEEEEKGIVEKSLKALMRADPDVILIGEVRDNITANGLIKAADSGHKVLSTTHVGSALEIIKRLYSFGVNPNDIASQSVLSCLIYQKLIPLLCTSCRIPFLEEENKSSVSEDLIALKSRLKMVVPDLSTVYLRNECGCEKCSFRGVTGRTVCAETIVPNLTLLAYFRDNKMIEARKYWRSLSDSKNEHNALGKTALEHAIFKVSRGLISPVDVEIELGFINSSYLEKLEIDMDKDRELRQFFDTKKINAITNKDDGDDDIFKL